MQTTHLSNKYAGTMGRIFQHPASHNLEWHDVIALIGHLGTVEEKDNGHLTFTVNGISQVFHRKAGKDISDVQQILDLRHFLNGAESGPAANGAIDTPEKLRLVVVVNQQETLIFRSEGKDSVPERLHPYDPNGVLHHLNHTKGEDATSRAPENLIYYQEIAAALAGADEALLLGHGSGASSAMAHLKDFLAAHYPATAAKIAGALTIDIEALTEGQLLQEARAFFLHHDGLDV